MSSWYWGTGIDHHLLPKTYPKVKQNLSLVEEQQTLSPILSRQRFTGSGEGVKSIIEEDQGTPPLQISRSLFFSGRRSESPSVHEHHGHKAGVNSPWNSRNEEGLSSWVHRSHKKTEAVLGEKKAHCSHHQEKQATSGQEGSVWWGRPLVIQVCAGTAKSWESGSGAMRKKETESQDILSTR